MFSRPFILIPATYILRSILLSIVQHTPKHITELILLHFYKTYLSISWK